MIGSERGDLIVNDHPFLAGKIVLMLFLHICVLVFSVACVFDASWFSRGYTSTCYDASSCWIK